MSEEATPTEASTKEADLVTEGRELFNEWMSVWSDNRDKYIEDVKFVWVKGSQWPEQIRNERTRDKRPCLEINQTRQYVRQITNDQRQNRPSIRVRPVGGGATEELAELYGGVIRGIEYESNAAAAYDTAFECMVAGGFGAWTVATEYADDESFDQVIRIKRKANPLCIVIDPMYEEADASDMTGAFDYVEMTKAEFDRRWPGKKACDFTVDMDGFKSWVNGDNIIVAKWHRVELSTQKVYAVSNGQGGWTKVPMENLNPEAIKALETAVKNGTAKCRTVEKKTVVSRIMNGQEVLETSTWAGKFVPVVPLFGDEVDVEGEKHLQGFVRPGRDAQQMYNFWVTAATEVAALQPKMPFIGYKGQFKDPKWATVHEKNYPYIEVDPTITVNGQVAPLPQRQSVDAGALAILQMAQASRFDLQSSFGMYDASLGQKSNETSGRAIVAREKQGDTGTFHYIDNLSRAIRYTGKILVDLIPKIYDTQRVLRIVKEDQTEAFEKVNEADPITGTVTNDLKLGSYDVVVDVGPSYATKRTESVEAMGEFMTSYPPAAQLIGDLYAESMDWPGARKIAERLKFMLPPEIKMAEAQKDPKMAAVVMPLQKQIEGMQQQLQKSQQMGQALAQENDALKRDISAKTMKAQADVAIANSKLQTSQQESAHRDESHAMDMQGKAMDAESKRQESEAKQAAQILAALIQLIKLQQTQAAPIAEQAAALAPTVEGIYGQAETAV